MQYRHLGRAGLRVSAVGFGGAPIGLQGYLGGEDRDSPAFQQRAIDAVREAVAKGINYFDTAPGYGDGRSERLLGQALEPHREAVHIATKIPLGDASTTEAARTDALGASLERLRSGHVEVLQLHGTRWSDEQAEFILTGGLLDWAQRMRDRGRFRLLGITAESSNAALERLVGSGRFDVLQVCYNLIYQGACDHQRRPAAGIIPQARELGMGILTMRSATSGFLQRLLAGTSPGPGSAAVTRLAIQFVLSTPQVDVALVGMSSVDEVHTNAAIADDLAGRLDLGALHERYPKSLPHDR